MILGCSLGINLGLGFQRGTTATTSSSPPAFAGNINSVVNSTSLSAAVTSDGQRHVFFQGSDGALFHTNFDPIQAQWPSSTSRVATPAANPPRNNTPIAFVGSLFTNGLHFNFIDSILLLYMNAANPLVAQACVPTVGTSKNLLNGSVSVAKGSRCFRVASLGLTNSSFEQEVAIFFESPGSCVTTLHAQYNSGFNVTSTIEFDAPVLQWVNVTRFVDELVSASSSAKANDVSPIAAPYNVSTTGLADVTLAYTNAATLPNVTSGQNATTKNRLWICRTFRGLVSIQPLNGSAHRHTDTRI